jgi:ABC-2 type transport system ATP-binding protein
MRRAPRDDGSGDEPLLSVQGLGRRYGEVVALEGLDLALGPGDAVALLGHNGSGKTTALHCIAGLLEPTTGSVRIVGADPHREPEAARARAALAFVADSPVFYRDLTVVEHVQLVVVSHGVSPDRTDSVLDELGLAQHREIVFPQQLSAGLRQRAQLACALVRPYRLLLLDEPTLRLDPGGQRWLSERLARACGDGAAVLFSTHQLEFASRLAARAVLLSEGRVLAAGPLDGVLASEAASETGIVAA